MYKKFCLFFISSLSLASAENITQCLDSHCALFSGECQIKNGRMEATFVNHSDGICIIHGELMIRARDRGGNVIYGRHVDPRNTVGPLSKVLVSTLPAPDNASSCEFETDPESVDVMEESGRGTLVAYTGPKSRKK